MATQTKYNPQNNNTSDVFTPREAAGYLQLAPDTIYRYIRSGKLVASRLGRQYRIPKQNIDFFLLVTSTSGGGKMRTFSKQEAGAWLKEDQLDKEAKVVSDNLLTNL